MDFIEKLFGKYPFIYYIGDKYYALGSGVCAECDTASVLLKSRYKLFLENIENDLSQDEAWKIYHKLMSEADFVKDKHGICVKPEQEILNFQFNTKEMEELKKQVKRNIEYWQKYDLKRYIP